MIIAQNIKNNASEENTKFDASNNAETATGRSQSPLAEGIQEYVELFRAAQSGAKTLSAARLRSDMGASAFEAPPAKPLQTFTTHIVLEGREIAVKIYHPGKDVTRPGICYFHGGGFAFGSIETFDSVAAGLAEETGAVVASVQYRRLPESRYNDAQEDCYAALLWLHQHAQELNIDPSRLCVCGDSVGALLATTTAIQARDRKGPTLACQILLYGAFALEPGRSAYTQSRDPLLTGENVEKFIALYQDSQGSGTTFIPPLLIEDLSGLPPAIIIAAEFDPLHDEGLEYAERLKAAGVEVEAKVEHGMIHGFLRARAISPAAYAAMKNLCTKAYAHLWPNAAVQTENRKDTLT